MSKNKNKNKNKGGNQRIGQAIAAAGKNLSGKEVKQIARQTGYTPQAVISRAEKADVTVKPSAQTFVQQAVQAQTQAQEERARQAANPGTTTAFDYTPQGTIGAVRYEPTSFIPETPSASSSVSSAASFAGASNPFKLEVDYAQEQTLRRLIEDAATERLKYEVDNRIPEIQAESKGRVDLQKIVNAGYRNIANIERGAQMASSIYGMFNF